MNKPASAWRGLVVGGAALLGACTPTAHEFLQDKTGIEVAREVRVCSNGVLRDDPRCRPSGRGGAPWVRNENFDIYNLQKPTDLAHWQSAIGEISVRYLGTPHWNERIQPSCKEDLPEGALPVAADASVDAIDLTAKLQQEAIQAFSVDAMASLRAVGLPVNPGVEARFRDQLARAVEQRINVRLLWFVVTYPGGRYAFENTPAFTRCRQAVHDHEREGARFVSGVAGFVVLQNVSDTSLTSTSTVAEALAGVVADPTPILTAKLMAKWERAVNRVVHVQARTQAMNQTVYPLWIQFE